MSIRACARGHRVYLVSLRLLFFSSSLSPTTTTTTIIGCEPPRSHTFSYPSILPIPSPFPNHVLIKPPPPPPPTTDSRKPSRSHTFRYPGKITTLLSYPSILSTYQCPVPFPTMFFSETLLTSFPQPDVPIPSLPHNPTMIPQHLTTYHSKRLDPFPIFYIFGPLLTLDMLQYSPTKVYFHFQPAGPTLSSWAENATTAASPATWHEEEGLAAVCRFLGAAAIAQRDRRGGTLSHPSFPHPIVTVLSIPLRRRSVFVLTVLHVLNACYRNWPITYLLFRSKFFNKRGGRGGKAAKKAKKAAAAAAAAAGA
ncbi:uncharacterized protein BDR25DRAFT_395715, partial [Lindgomyces ingoldianus]